MALVYSGFSTHRLFAASQAAAARLSAVATEAARRLLNRFLRASISDLGESEHRSSREVTSRHPPGSVFDARYKGLSAQAAHIDAAIRRQERPR
jgi:hypothetical protein